MNGDEAAEDALTAEERRSIVEAHIALSGELTSAGKLVVSEALTRLVAHEGVRNGSVTDGPFAETKEVVGGFYLLELKPRRGRSPGRSRCIEARGLAVEVRPVAAGVRV